MATRSHFLVIVSLALTISLHISSTEALRDLPFFHRAAFTPRVCKPEVVDRAVHCGCFGYRRFYRKYPEWGAIQEYCEEESDERLTRSAVLGDCRRSRFVRSGKIGLRKMNRYFKKVNDVCMTPSKVRPGPSESPRPTEIGTETTPTKVPPYEVPPFEEPTTKVPPSLVSPSEEPLYEEEGFNEPIFEMQPSEEPLSEVPPTKVPPTKVPPSKVPPTKVPPTVGIPKTTLPSAGKTYPSTLPAETVRIRYEFVHKMLSRFCLVLVHRRRIKLTARQVYNICCPRGR